MVPDVLATYGVNLGELVSDQGDLSPRLALAYIEGLPSGCRSWAELQGDTRLAGWDVQTYLLAGLVESVRENTFATVQIQSKKKLKRPEPMSIPGTQQKKKPQQNMFAKMAAAQLRAGKG